MRVFVNRCDGYVGGAVGAAFAGAGHELVGTVGAQAQKPTWLGDTVLTDETMQDGSVMELLLSADVVVLDLEGCEAAARKAAMTMANQKATGKEKVFIGISNPMTWADTSLPDQLPEMPSFISEGMPFAGSNMLPRTGSAMSQRPGTSTTDKPGTADANKPAPAATDKPSTADKPGTGKSGASAKGQPEPPAQDAAAEGVGDGEGQEEQLGADDSLHPDAFGPMPLSGFDYERRQGAPGAAALTAAENCILRAARKNKLATYIICPGVLYGAGERDHLGLHQFFRAAYECKPLRMYCAGANWLPMLHVSDLGTYCAAVADSRPPNQYLLAADEQIATFGKVVKEISSRFGVGAVTSVPYEEMVFSADTQYLQLNLPFKLTWADEATAPELKYSQGLLASLDDIYSEYLTARNLSPLRVLLRGGPASGKSHLAARLSSMYGLRHVDVKAILEHRNQLPDDDELKKEVNAQLASKEGRVSEKNLALLAYQLLNDIRIRHKGYVLDGFPRSMGTMKWLMTKQQEMSEEELEAWREEQAAVAAATGAPPPKAAAKGGKDKDKGGKGAKGGKGDAEAEPPTDHPRVLATEVMPNFALTLDVAEELMAERTAKVFAVEHEEVQKLIAEGKVDAKKPPPPSHHCDKDFQRRLAAWKALREVDQSDVRAKVDAIRSVYEAALAEYEAKKAEVEAAEAAVAEAAAAAEDGDVDSSPNPLPEVPEMPEPPVEPTYPEFGGLDELLRTWGVDMVVMDGWPQPVVEEEAAAEGEDSEAPPDSVKAENSAGLVMEEGKGLVGFQLTSARRAVPGRESLDAIGSVAGTRTPTSAPPIELTAEEAAAEAARLAAEDPIIRSNELLERVKALLGLPHNYEGFVKAAELEPPNVLAAPPPASTVAPSASGMTSVAPEPAAPPPILEQRALAAYAAARSADKDRMAAPVLKYLVDQVMPMLSKALVEVSRVRPEKPLEFVGNFLIEAGEELNAAYHDPYDTDIYSVQAEKIRMSAARAEVRASKRAEKDAREAALANELEMARMTSRRLTQELKEAELAALADAAAEVAGGGGASAGGKKPSGKATPPAAKGAKGGKADAKKAGGKKK